MLRLEKMSCDIVHKRLTQNNMPPTYGKIGKWTKMYQQNVISRNTAI
jgi:hypothetical protein